MSDSCTYKFYTEQIGDYLFKRQIGQCSVTIRELRKTMGLSKKRKRNSKRKIPRKLKSKRRKNPLEYLVSSTVLFTPCIQHRSVQEMQEDRSSPFSNETPKMNHETGQKQLGWDGQGRVRRHVCTTSARAVVAQRFIYSIYKFTFIITNLTPISASSALPTPPAPTSANKNAAKKHQPLP